MSIIALHHAKTAVAASGRSGVLTSLQRLWSLKACLKGQKCSNQMRRVRQNIGLAKQRPDQPKGAAVEWTRVRSTKEARSSMLEQHNGDTCTASRSVWKVDQTALVAF